MSRVASHESRSIRNRLKSAYVIPSLGSGQALGEAKDLSCFV
jgi:hypothetical protein